MRFSSPTTPTTNAHPNPPASGHHRPRSERQPAESNANSPEQSVNCPAGKAQQSSGPLPKRKSAAVPIKTVFFTASHLAAREGKRLRVRPSPYPSCCSPALEHLSSGFSRMAWLAGADEVVHRVLGAAVLHRYAVVDLVGDPQQPGCSSSQRGLANSLALRVMAHRLRAYMRLRSRASDRRARDRWASWALRCSSQRPRPVAGLPQRGSRQSRMGTSAAPRWLPGAWWCSSAPRPALTRLAKLLGVVVAVDVVERDQQRAAGRLACERSQLVGCPLGCHQFNLRP